MGYIHIDNLYKSQDILLFKECYALEKVHGTSAHIGWKDGQLRFFSGGESHERFEGLFDQEKLQGSFVSLAESEVTIYGEAYGGKCQGMSDTYGKELAFIVFDVRIGDSWLSVPDAEQITSSFGLEFVPFSKITTGLASIDFQRDAPSVVAQRRGITEVRKREGVVLRPLIELTKNNGDRIISKHKRDEFRESATPKKVVSPEKLAVLQSANDIAQEWVTTERLGHVLQKCPADGMESTPSVIKAMIEDVYREATGEVIESPEATRAIGKRTAELLKSHFKAQLISR